MAGHRGLTFEGDRITNGRVSLDRASMLTQIGRGDLLVTIAERS